MGEMFAWSIKATRLLPTHYLHWQISWSWPQLRPFNLQAEGLEISSGNCNCDPEVLQSFIKGGLNDLFFLYGVPEQLVFSERCHKHPRVNSHTKLVFKESSLSIIKEFKPKNPRFLSISSSHQQE